MNVCVALGSFQKELKNSQGGFTGFAFSQHLVQLFLKNVRGWESVNVSTTRICRVWSGGKLQWAILEPRQPSTSLKLSSETSWRETEQAAVVVGSLGSCQLLFLCYNRITQSQSCMARSGCTFITTSCLQPSSEVSRGWTRPIGKDRRQASNWLHCRLCNDCEGYCFPKPCRYKKHLGEQQPSQVCQEVTSNQSNLSFGMQILSYCFSLLMWT